MNDSAHTLIQTPSAKLKADGREEMTLTVLSDDQVKGLLEGLTLDELDDFRQVLASALHEYSTSTQADEDGAFQQPHRITTCHPASKATTLYMPSCGPAGMGCKVVSLTTSEATKDPNVKAISPTGVVNLFSPEGDLIGLVHASTLTAFRTALASLCLVNRRNHVRTLVVFGSGQQAYWHILLALKSRGHTIRHVHIINHHFSESARNILKRFTIIPAEAKKREGWESTKFSILTPSFHEYERLLKEHLRQADVIYCCTPSRHELFDASILTNTEGRKKGRLIVAIGSFTPEMRELPEGLLLQATKHHEKGHRHFHKHADEGGVIVVDTLDGALQEAGEIIAAKIPATQLVELGELVMLHRLAVEESENESLADSEADSLSGSFSAMSTVYGTQSSRSNSRTSSPTRSSSPSSGRKPSFPLPFRRSSHSSSEQSEKKREDSLASWLRSGTVIYKSVGFGVMDLSAAFKLISFAADRGVGTQIDFPS